MNILRRHLFLSLCLAFASSVTPICCSPIAGGYSSFKIILTAGLLFSNSASSHGAEYASKGLNLIETVDGDFIITGYAENYGEGGAGSYFEEIEGNSASEGIINHRRLLATEDPTTVPTINPTIMPTINPTVDPTEMPTINPTNMPTTNPTTNPTFMPTTNPTIDPTFMPTTNPTTNPTFMPTTNPTTNPTGIPSMSPTDEPTGEPTMEPTRGPFKVKIMVDSPTSAPTVTEDEDVLEKIGNGDIGVVEGFVIASFVLAGGTVFGVSWYLVKFIRARYAGGYKGVPGGATGGTEMA